MRDDPHGLGRRFHAGIDIAIHSGADPNVRTIAGGQVIGTLTTAESGGFGNAVAIRTPDGYIEQYNHLESIGVTVGEVIQPGTSIGGQGSTGKSTGPHIDFMVYKPEVSDDEWGRGGYEQLTINPRDYMGMVLTLQEAPRNTGVMSAPANLQAIPGDATLQEAVNIFQANWNRHVPQGVLVGNGFVESPSTAYTGASPQRASRASIFRSSYIAPGNVQVHNDPANNYGYAALAEDREYRIALARTASRLNIPAMWLADVIDYETIGTHSPSIDNGLSFTGSGAPCTGLIQFCDIGGLADLAEEWGTRSLWAVSQRLKVMSRAEQLEWVGWWLGRYSNGGRDLETIEDLYSLINGGTGALQASLSRRERIQDRNGRLPEHFAKFGNRVGRRYQTSYDRLEGGAGSIHTGLVAGCSECQRHMNLWNKVEPHYPP